MKLKEYIQGDRHGKEANRLEREALTDPFLQEALEGFDAVSGDHAKTIEQLEKRYIKADREFLVSPNEQLSDGINGILPLNATQHQQDDVNENKAKRRSVLLFWSAAATLLLLLSFGVYFLLQKNDSNKANLALIQSEKKEMQIEDDVSFSEKQAAEQESQPEMLDVSPPVQKSAMQVASSAKSKKSQDIIEIAKNIAIDEEPDEIVSEDDNSNKKVPTNNLSKSLGGRIAGLVTMQDGQQRSLDDFFVRGTGDISNKNALVIIDGKEIDSTIKLNSIKPEEIESFTVLKDAETTAIYGTRAANGVVLVTTKKVVAERPETINFSGKILDEAGNALPGVSISIKEKTLAGTVTDENGNFNIQIPNNDSIKLIAQYFGFEKHEFDFTDYNNTITLIEDNKTQLEEVVVTAFGALKKTARVNATSPMETSKRNTARRDKNENFGEKEFQSWCQKTATKNICDGKNVAVKVSFYIDEVGKPTQIKYDRFTCESAKEEIANLLSTSPTWTKTNRKVTITVRW